MIDWVHERPEETARHNFNENRKRLIQGLDYLKVCANEIRMHKILELSPKAHEDVTLFTEQGYMMLVKSLTDDLPPLGHSSLTLGHAPCSRRQRTLNVRWYRRLKRRYQALPGEVPVAL
ncbi:MAG: ORF6N domain-containing protein [Pseudomonas sp.]|uniref:ORF6N domain-containing protein n=1 Tax=Pseudomonas sp. TaxID=306 RepID=UPI003D6E6BBF